MTVVTGGNATLMKTTPAKDRPMPPPDRYDVYIEVERAQRMSERARRQEPRELFAEVIDALVANGWQLCGDVRVRRKVLDVGTGEYL